MTGTPHAMVRFFLWASLCALLAVPAELHGTIVEVGAHDVEGAVSVDARHAGQEAHFEHSAVEMQSRCVACVLTQRSEVLPLRPEIWQLRMPQAGSVSLLGAPDLDSRLDRRTTSRAPPLF